MTSKSLLTGLPTFWKPTPPLSGWCDPPGALATHCVTVGTQVWLPLRAEGSLASTPRATKVPETCGAQRPGVEQGGGKKGGGTEECWAVLDTACKTPLYFALCYLATSSCATPHPVANIQPLSLGHLSPNMCSHSFVPLPMRFPCAGIPFPLLSTWGTPAHPSGPSSNVTSSGKPSLLLRKDESFPPCAPTAFVLTSLDTEAQFIVCI